MGLILNKASQFKEIEPEENKGTWRYNRNFYFEKGWHHAYLGLAMLGYGIATSNWWFIITGWAIFQDDMNQHFIQGRWLWQRYLHYKDTVNPKITWLMFIQKKVPTIKVHMPHSLAHYVFGKHLYKFKWVQAITRWFDKLFGKGDK